MKIKNFLQIKVFSQTVKIQGVSVKNHLSYYMLFWWLHIAIKITQMLISVAKNSMVERPANMVNTTGLVLPFYFIGRNLTW
jgi:hypothetical protein